MSFSLKRSLSRLVHDPKKFAENAGRSVGQGAKAVAPFLPPGFRELAAVGGDIAAGGNMKSHALSLAGAELGSAMGGRAAGQAIGNSFKAGGFTGVKDALAAKIGLGGAQQAAIPVQLGTTGAVMPPGGVGNAAASAGGNFLGNLSASDKIALAKMGMDVFGGAAKGVADAKSQKAALEEQQRQFNIPQAEELTRSAQTAPFRDQGMYGMQSYLGQQPAAARPHDLFNPSSLPQQQGGYNQQLLAQRQSQYTPGAGGINTDLEDKLLRQLGYPRRG